MPSIWSPQARKVLRQLQQKRVLLAFDFDGTLVPHFPAPNPVVVAPETLRLLRLINEHIPLAIVTGRSVADISQFLDPKEFLIVGNYGCETPWMTMSQQKKMHAKAALVRKSFEDFLEHHGLLHRVFVEDKAHSLSLHSKDMKLLRRIDTLARHATSTELRPHRRQFGIGTLNIFPEGAPNKGDAVLEIMKRKQCTHAIFSGDDLPDEDVFELMKQVTGVRVGYRKNTHAKFHVKSQEEMDEFLALMVSVFCFIDTEKEMPPFVFAQGDISFITASLPTPVPTATAAASTKATTAAGTAVSATVATSAATERRTRTAIVGRHHRTL